MFCVKSLLHTLLVCLSCLRSDVRMIASTVKEKKLAIIYGSTEAEPISIIPAKEKMALEESRPDGLCVGKPVMEGTVKIISASDGVLYKIHNVYHIVFCTNHGCMDLNFLIVFVSVFQYAIYKDCNGNVLVVFGESFECLNMFLSLKGILNLLVTN